MRGRTKRIWFVLSCLMSVCMFSYRLLSVKAEAKAICKDHLWEYMGEQGTGTYVYRSDGDYEIINIMFRCSNCHIEMVGDTTISRVGDHDFITVKYYYKDYVEYSYECKVCGHQESSLQVRYE